MLVAKSFQKFVFILLNCGIKIFNQWTRTHCATTAWPGDVLGAAAAVHHREPVQVIPDQGAADEPERPAPPEREPHGDAPAPDHDL